MSLSVFLMLLALQGISGGVSGYTTNKYAVNMLFKEYTPFKLGGVIKKKKEKFIDEISDLVERDIVNSETLKESISNKKIENQIQQTVKIFLESSLKNSFGNTKVSEISGFSESVVKSKDFICNKLDEFLPSILENVLDNVNLNNILSENQISHIVDVGYKLVVEELEKNDVLKEYLNDIYEENSDLILSQIFEEEFKNKLVKNITEIIMTIIENDILQDDKQFEFIFNNICSQLNINTTLIKLQGLIGEYKINEFITLKEEKQISLGIFNKINEFINSQKGKELIGNIIDEIISIGKKSEFAIYEILPSEMEDSITNFIKSVVPKVVPYVSDWISDNKDSLDKMIECAIDEAIGNIDESIKQVILSKVRSAFMGDISAKNNIVKKITDYINDNVDDESYSKLSNSIIEYLKTKKINDILKSLEQQNLLDSEILTQFVTKQFGLHGTKIIDMIIKSQSIKKVNQFVNLDLVKLFNEKIKTLLINKILNNKDKIVDRFKQMVLSSITKKSDEIFSKSLNHLINKDQVTSASNGFSKLINKFINSNEITYKEQIHKLISSQINNVNLKELVEPNKKEVVETISETLISLCNDKLNKYKECELKEVIELAINKEELTKSISKGSHEKLITNLPKLVDGKIKGFVYGNLEKYNEDEICMLAQNFMGNQLKPLSVFGGVLGTVVGLIYGLATYDSMNIYGTSSSLLSVLESCVIMAGVGVATNVIALWMIFHPYKENKIISKIPFLKTFAMGYIPAHKNEFAIGMAKLIDEELLNKESISKKLNGNKIKIESSLMKLVSNNNYQLIVNFAKRKKQSIKQGIYKIISKYCSDSSFLNKLSLTIGNTDLNKLIKRSSALNLANGTTQLVKNKDLEDNLTKLFYDKVTLDCKFKDILSDELVDNLNDYLKNKTKSAINNKVESLKKDEIIENIIVNNNDTYTKIIQKSCREIFDEALIIRSKNSIQSYIENFIVNDSKEYINNYIKKLLLNEFNESNTIGSVFNGKVKNIVDNNLLILTNWITNKLINYLNDNEYKISASVKETISNELNFFEKLAYSAFGGDRIVEDVVSIILRKKLPIMIEDESNKVNSLVKISLDNTIYPTKISELKIKANEINIGLLFENLLEQITNSNIVKNKIYNLSDLILDHIIDIPLINYLETCNLNSLELIHKKFYNEITLVQADFYDNINKILANDSNIIYKFLNEKILTELLNQKSTNLFKDINRDEFEYTIRNILKLFTLSNNTQKHITNFVGEVYDDNLSNYKLNKLVDLNILREDIENSMSLMFKQNKFNDTNLDIIEKVIEEILNEKLDFVDKKCKDYLTSQIIKSALDAIEHQIIPILKTIDLKSITNKQINLMNPEEIHILFKKVIGEFFMKLYLYGIMGGVFGINLWLTIILCGLDFAYSKTILKEQGCIEN